MRRVLFVDDEQRVLDGLENSLFEYADDWDMEFVNGGEAALTLMSRTEDPFDVIVTDMRMPEVDGVAVLQEVHQRYPTVVRIVLSGHTELEAAARALPIAHQFLSKPCRGPALIEALDRACALQALTDSGLLRSVLGQIGTLPARPKVFAALSRVLADEKSSLQQVAHVIKDDIAISAKVLHIANTAFFSAGRTISTIEHAVPLLGAKLIGSLVLAEGAFQELNSDAQSFTMERFHDHAFLVADVAKRVAGEEDVENAYMAGLLHDVGKLVLACKLPMEFDEVSGIAHETGRAMYEIEEDLKDVTHAEVGAYLLGLWGLPYPVLEAVANHHSPQRVVSSTFDAVSAVYVANVLVHECLGEAPANFDMGYLEQVGVAQRLPAWREMVAELVASKPDCE